MIILLIILLLVTPATAGIDFSKIVKSSPVYAELQGGAELNYNKMAKGFNRSITALPDGRPITPEEIGWKYTDTPLEKIEAAFKFRIDDIVEDFRKTKPNDEIVIFDWGCGNGQALRDIKKLGLDNVKLVGFSNMYFPEWNNKGNEGIEYIWDNAWNLTKYLDDNRIDLVFSHLGLSHLGADGMMLHLNELRPKLKNESLIITNHYLKTLEPVFESLFPEYTIDSYRTATKDVLALEPLQEFPLDISSPALAKNFNEVKNIYIDYRRKRMRRYNKYLLPIEQELMLLNTRLEDKKKVEVSINDIWKLVDGIDDAELRSYMLWLKSGLNTMRIANSGNRKNIPDIFLEFSKDYTKLMKSASNIRREGAVIHIISEVVKWVD